MREGVRSAADVKRNEQRLEVSTVTLLSTMNAPSEAGVLCARVRVVPAGGFAVLSLQGMEGTLVMMLLLGVTNVIVVSFQSRRVVRDLGAEWRG